jgi:hypothetical protein
MTETLASGPVAQKHTGTLRVRDGELVVSKWGSGIAGEKFNGRSWGGVRKGAGRPMQNGAYTDLTMTERRKIFYDMVTPEEFLTIVKNYIDGAKKNPAQAEFIINQLIGKAPQAIELSGPGGEAIKIDI